MIHGSVAMVAFLALPVAAMLLSGPIGKVSGSHLFTRWLNGLASMSVITLLAFFVCLAPIVRHHAPHLLGLAERLLLAAYIGWLGTSSVAAGRAASAD